MKKTIEQGKIWLIACIISLGSFLFLQLDQQNLERKQLVASAELTIEEADEFNEELIFDYDIIKGISAFVIEVILLKQ